MQARIEPLVVPTLPVILEPAPRIHVALREQSSVLDEPRIHRPRAELADLSRTTELDPRVKSEDDTLKAWASRPRANGQARRSDCETKSCRQRVGEVGTDRALHRQSTAQTTRHHKETPRTGMVRGVNASYFAVRFRPRGDRQMRCRREPGWMSGTPSASARSALIPPSVPGLRHWPLRPWRRSAG